MSVLSLSNQLRHELLRRRLPRFYVHRAVREYADHFHDLIREGVSDDSSAARLGDPQALAAQLATEYRARHFAGRHPWLVFALAPIPCTILAAALFIAIGATTVELLEPVLGAVSLRCLLVAVFYTSLTLPMLGATWFFGRWAIRSGCGARWFWTSSALVCALAAATQFKLSFATDTQDGSLIIGLALPPQINWLFLALPLLTAIGLAWHVTHRATPTLVEQ